MAEENKREYYRERRKLRTRQKWTKIGALLGGLLLIFASAWFVAGRIQAAADSRVLGAVSGPPPAGVSSVGTTTEAGGYVPAPPTTEPVDNSAWNIATPISEEPPVADAPDYRMLALPQNGRIDMSYFDNVTFVGDSLTQGLFIYDIFPNAHYCAYQGVSPRAIYSGQALNRHARLGGGTEVPLDAMEAQQPDNVYIMMGLNAMVGLSNEDVVYYYNEMVDAIRARLHPEVSFYIQSVTPVRPVNDPKFTMDRIHQLNNMLAKLAYEKGIHFVDLNEVLIGPDGWMREEYGARDGYHMNKDGYLAWRDYLTTHTAFHRRHNHLYTEGNPPVAPE